MVLDIFITRLSVIAELGWVVSALEREEAHKMSDVLLLESEEDIKERKKVFPFSLYFC